jgi:hypothetical protein
MRNRLLISLIVLIALLLFATGFGVGRFVTVQQLASTELEAPVAVSVVDASGEMIVPERDVTGEDIDGLPRYPGSVRVEYRYAIFGDLAETEVEYVVYATLEEVHDFYRQVFEEMDWIVADVGIYQGEWTFFIVSGKREAILELEVRQSLIEIEIELSEPFES